ncbi:hypothetical protein [Streptomyces sp. GbtcB7]|uniref:hypothetical protein n=1 Tax=Streptomyces sp. GbtcB7 TaxID=2824752 RepID=UPI001C3081AF|nr:hypothetical protein [Streptomyces sp. GbtcB7]
MRPLFRPALATDDISGYVLAYEKDPDNHIAVRGYADLDALLFRERLPRLRCAAHPVTLRRGTPDITSVHDGTVRVHRSPPGTLRHRP